MDMQDAINMMNDTVKRTSAQEYNLGRFIKDLQLLDQKKLIYIEKDVACAGLDSWRSSYCELAMEYAEGGKSKVKDVLKNAKETLNKTLIGYKGGDFIMDAKTPIHIANYGECSFGIPKYQYEFKCENPKNNFVAHYQVKLIGIKNKDKYYQLKLRIDED